MGGSINRRKKINRLSAIALKSIGEKIMPITNLTNSGDLTGDIYGETGVVATTNTVATSLITGITATKAVDKDFWINGPLVYTITVNNTSGEPYDNVVLTDTLNALITLDTTAEVLVNGVASTDYSFTGGVLTVPVGDIADGATATVVFQVVRV